MARQAQIVRKPARPVRRLQFGNSFPRRDECSIPGQRARHRAERPEAPALVFDDDSLWSYAELHDRVPAMAAGLRHLGVGQGDLVINWQPNSGDFILVWFAIASLGAIELPLNVAFRGNLLGDVIRRYGARLMICTPDLFARLEGIDPGSLERIVVIRGKAPAGALDRPVAILDPGALEVSPLVPADLPEPAPWDIGCLILTSGATGFSKLARTPLAQLWTLGQAMYGFLRPDDRLLNIYPLFHIAAIGGVLGALSKGSASFRLRRSAPRSSGIRSAGCGRRRCPA